MWKTIQRPISIIFGILALLFFLYSLFRLGVAVDVLPWTSELLHFRNLCLLGAGVSVVQIASHVMKEKKYRSILINSVLATIIVCTIIVYPQLDVNQNADDVTAYSFDERYHVTL